MTIKVLIVDDSALMRALLTQIISAADDLEVVGEAPDPLVAREMIKVLNPDVLTLDIEMPRMDGLEFLRRLMQLRPMPVVMISSLTDRGSEATLTALELGAVDFIPKPRLDDPQRIAEISTDICDKLRAAAGAQLGRARPAPAAAAQKKSSQLPAHVREKMLVAIGASTGGTEAVKDVLAGLPEDMPPIVITQHMPPLFTTSYAQRLDRSCALRVIEAQGGERLEPGCAYLAPGHSHLRVSRRGGLYYTELSQAEPVNRHRPSVDVMFDSVVASHGARSIGVILTGMGRDGAAGLLALRQAGAWTIGQDQASCVVYGMPREAARLDALEEVSPLPRIAERIVTRLRASSDS
jgi:two-component system chemotaxis response regulator CheB